jgi:hypothetical protein
MFLSIPHSTRQTAKAVPPVNRVKPNGFVSESGKLIPWVQFFHLSDQDSANIE